VPRPVQLVPSDEYAIEFVPPPTATHIFELLFHATLLPPLNIEVPRPVQLVPLFDEYAIEFVPAPVATHIFEPYATLSQIPTPLNINEELSTPVQLVPFDEYAIEYGPEPTATHDAEGEGGGGGGGGGGAGAGAGAGAREFLPVFHRELTWNPRIEYQSYGTLLLGIYLFIIKGNNINNYK
jgi:hypothetical protein